MSLNLIPEFLIWYSGILDCISGVWLEFPLFLIVQIMFKFFVISKVCLCISLCLFMWWSNFLLGIQSRKKLVATLCSPVFLLLTLIRQSLWWIMAHWCAPVINRKWLWTTEGVDAASLFIINHGFVSKPYFTAF